MKNLSPAAVPEAGKARKAGRPLSFDRDAALQQAMLQFWRHGFESTSISDLTAAMGIAAPSLYAAFGDKKQLFLAALERYLGGPVTAQSLIRDAATARQAAHDLLHAAATGYTQEGLPRGCLLGTATLSCSADSADLQTHLAALRRAIETALRKRLAQAVTAGELPPSFDPDIAAAHVAAVIQGMSTLARDGARRSKLLQIADAALAGWPA